MSRLERLLFALAVAACSTPLFAAGGGEVSETFLGIPRWIWLWLNLLVFLGVLGYFIVPPTRTFLIERARGIREDLDRAKHQEVEAAEMKASLEGQMAELRAEMQGILEKARVDGEREREEILKQAEVERERLLRQAQEEIAHRVDAARDNLQAFTARLAAEMAQERIEQALTPEDVQRLFDESVGYVDREAS